MKRSVPKRATIGITPDFDGERYVIKESYVRAVTAVGAMPLVLPYSTDFEVLRGYLNLLSGLLISGGAFDIAPEIYGEKPRPGLGKLLPERTTFELTLLKSAMGRRLPVLGICGGMQLINVAFGGTLHQHLPDDVPGALRHEQSHDRTQPQHPVEVTRNSLLARWMGHGQVMVNSTHHQAINRVGSGLEISAVSPDGIVEGIESLDGAVVGVQWHPEMLIDTVPAHIGVYRGFAALALKGLPRRGGVARPRTYVAAVVSEEAEDSHAPRAR